MSDCRRLLPHRFLISAARIRRLRPCPATAATSPRRSPPPSPPRPGSTASVPAQPSPPPRRGQAIPQPPRRSQGQPGSRRLLLRSYLGGHRRAGIEERRSTYSSIAFVERSGKWLLKWRWKEGYISMEKIEYNSVAMQIFKRGKIAMSFTIIMHRMKDLALERTKSDGMAAMRW
ncbi:unnamed protein product [Urochloa humidicola]